MSEASQERTLAQRLAAGPLKLPAALRLGARLATLLEEVHRRGEAFGRLRPEAVAVDEGSSPEVLRLLVPDKGGYSGPDDATDGPHARRGDFYALGCLLYECLTGDRALIAKGAQPDWENVPETVPAEVLRLLQRLTRRDPERRPRHMGDVRMVLEEAARSLDASVWTTVSPRGPHRRRKALREVAVFAVALAGTLAVLFFFQAGQEAPPAGTRRLAVPLDPEDPEFHTVDVTQDGQQLLYQAGTYLRVRGIAAASSATLAAGGRLPFFSPDGEWVGYFRERSIYKVRVPDGTPVKVCDVASLGVGASWGEDGVIVYTPQWSGGLWKVPADGGEPEELTRPDPDRFEVSHRWPYVLPGAEAVLLTIKTSEIQTFDEAAIGVASLPTGEVRVLLEGGTSPRYAASGHLLYVRDHRIHAAPFDLKSLQVTGPAVAVVDGVFVDYQTGQASYGVSRDGTLVYVPQWAMSFPRESLVRVDRSGRVEQLTEEPELRDFASPRPSPDGRQALVTVYAANNNLWLYDLERGTGTRLIFGHGNNATGIWSPDGESIVFSRDREGSWELARMHVKSGEIESLWRSEFLIRPTSWSRVRDEVAFVETHSATHEDIWILSLDTPRPAVRPWLQTRFLETDPTFSPDGRYLAYSWNESGKLEVYVQAYPGPGPRAQVSNGGGAVPSWSPDGRELFYISGRHWTAVDVATEPALRVGMPHALFSHEDLSDVTSFDGERFLAVRRNMDPRPELRSFPIVLDWFDELSRRAPPER